MVTRHRQPSLRLNAKTEVTRDTAPSCVALVNHGTHSTVNIEIGTPEQEFSVVADTGSDSVIVPSCICMQTGHCSQDDRCFTGTNHSSTFNVSGGEQGPLATVVQFGSGPIEAVIASDIVRVGQESVRMDNGVLLMVDQNLDIMSAFEGILGLGLPKDKRLPMPEVTHQPEAPPADGLPPQLGDIIQQIMGGQAGGGMPLSPHVTSALATGTGLPVNGSAPPSELAESNASWPSWPTWPFSKAAEEPEPEPEQFENVGFLETAGVARFSMCFNDGADGMLRLNPPAAAKTLGNVGRQHWALDFRGISVGGNATLLDFCGTDGMREGQETPCGAIPDSGTTVIMAPQEQLNMLFEGLCEEWDRCKQNHTAMLEAAEAAHEAAESTYNVDPFDIKPVSKSAIFQFLLMDCGSWLDPATNLDELPSLNFNVVGANGTDQTLEMPGWSYVIESAEAEDGSRPKVCQPAFGAMEMDTDLNGPVWIFGTPFFYMFDIGYDLESDPAGISLTSVEESPCGSCDSDGTVSLVAGSTSALAKQRRQRAPRRVEGRRWPSIDVSRPL